MHIYAHNDCGGMPQCASFSSSILNYSNLYLISLIPVVHFPHRLALVLRDMCACMCVCLASNALLLCVCTAQLAGPSCMLSCLSLDVEGVCCLSESLSLSCSFCSSGVSLFSPALHLSSPLCLLRI